jgi:regulation of enolase protein 1 (concanavalin A-like superfamily)
MTESALRLVEICVARIVCVVFVLALVLSPTGARAQVPAPWTSDDVGNTAIAGSASHASGLFTLQGSGSEIWNTADGFHFVYRTLTGDGEIIARLDSLTRASAGTKAGVMMRDGLGPSDPNAFALVTPDRVIRLQQRRSPGWSTGSSYTGTGAAPYWVRLVRAGNKFRGYFSPDGVTWTAGGSTSIVMGSTIYVGLAVTSGNQSALATAVFRSVTVRSTAGNRPPVVTITSPADGAELDEPADITLSASATDTGGTIQQVQFFNGSTLIATDTTSPYSTIVKNVVAGSYTLRAVALDNHGATGSSSVSVTVRPGSSTWDNEDVGNVSLAGSATFTFNGATIRGAGADIWGTADSFHFAYQTLTGDGEVVARLDSQQRTDPGAKAGVMMRETLSAISSHASAFQTPDYGPAFQRRTMPGGTSTHTAGSGTVGTRWLKIARKGSAFTASESANGTTWAVIGSQTITMQPTIYAGLAVTSHNTGALSTATFSNVSVQGTAPSPNNPPAVSLTSPASGASFTAPATISIAANASDADGSVTQVQFFSGSTLLATDTTSPYSYSWTNVAAGSYSLTAVARDNLGATRTSAAVSITVTPATLPPMRAVFGPSPDHAVVTHYLLEIYRAGETPGTVPPVASLNMGKPAVVNNEISVNIEIVISGLAPGNYVATVSAVNAAGSGRSAPAPFVR